jgi:hypothetical protein
VRQPADHHGRRPDPATLLRARGIRLHSPPWRSSQPNGGNGDGSSARAGGSPTTLTCQAPVASEAQRWTVILDDGRGRSEAWLYLPIAGSRVSDPRSPSERATAALDAPPLLLAIYPGPVEGGVCQHPLAAAGYGVLAAGPPYGLSSAAGRRSCPPADGRSRRLA